MNTTTIGKTAEKAVSEVLTKRGHKILDLNWRTKSCEIDIVSHYKKTVYFTEVKYRSSSTWGDGFEYITKKKLDQMKYAVKMWVASNNWERDVLLQAAAVNADLNIQIIEL